MMTRTSLVTVILILVASPALAGSFVIEAGLTVPSGNFAEPVHSTLNKGAEGASAFGLEYISPLVVLDLVVGLSYLKFGEKYRGNVTDDVPEPQDYSHLIIPVTIGLRKHISRTWPIQPYLGAGAGLYGYAANGSAWEREAGTDDWNEESFTAVVRPGINFSLGVLVDLPFSFDLIGEAKYHVMVFQGVGDDPTDREFPYPKIADSLNFATFMVGVVF